MRMMPAINLKRYQFSSLHTKIMKSYSALLMSHLNLALIQLKQMIKNSKLRVVVLFNRIEPGNFCFVKLLKLMHHYLMVI